MINAVITRNKRLNGTTFDTFEYFYRLWELDKSIKLVSETDNFNPDFLNKKYEIDNSCFNNIIIDKPENLKYNNVLAFDVFQWMESNIECNNFYLMNNDKVFPKYQKNVKYFDEYDTFRNYTYKIYYQIQKIYEHKEGTYIKCFDFNIDVYKIIKKYKNVIITEKNNYIPYTELKNFTGDFFKNFNKFVCIKYGSFYDRHPRIYLECANQGIDCEYINLTPEIDNGYFRYKDRFDFEKRNIKKDKILEEFLEL